MYVHVPIPKYRDVNIGGRLSYGDKVELLHVSTCSNFLAAERKGHLLNTTLDSSTITVLIRPLFFMMKAELTPPFHPDAFA